MRKVQQGSELFQVTDRGTRTDANLLLKLLGTDDRGAVNINDPKQVAERLRLNRERLARRRAEAKGAL